MLSDLIPKEEIDALLGRPVDISRPYTHQDIVYLLNQHPFIQIISAQADFTKDNEIKITKSVSGWNILDYGDALCSSAGEFMFGGNDDKSFIKRILDGEKNDGNQVDDTKITINPGKGTIIKQTYDTVQEIIDIAISKGWPGIEFIDGSPLMASLLWQLCEEKGLTLEGYTPEEKEEEEAKRKQRAKEVFEKAPIFQNRPE
jgi:hypothetical protein